mgnify:CR=1 FL=1
MTDEDEVLKKEIKDWQGVYNLLMSPNYDLVFMPNKKMAEDLAKDMFRIFAQQRNKVLDEFTTTIQKYIDSQDDIRNNFLYLVEIKQIIAELKKGVVK